MKISDMIKELSMEKDFCGDQEIDREKKMSLSVLIRLLDLTFNTLGDCQGTDIKRLTELEDKHDDDKVLEKIEIKIHKGE